MATWNVGPFDNDEAEEWCDRLRSTDPAQRGELVETALSVCVARTVELTPAASSEGLAAAAVVFEVATGKPAPTMPYATVVLTDIEGVEPTPRLIGLARAALETLMARESAFRQNWAGHVEEDLALGCIERIYDGLKE